MFQPHSVKVNGDLIRNAFVHSLAHREQFRLFGNGTNEGIPIQYRFPPMYKLIEMQFRRAKSNKRQRNPYGMGSGIGATVPSRLSVTLGMGSGTDALFLRLSHLRFLVVLIMGGEVIKTELILSIWEL